MTALWLLVGFVLVGVAFYLPGRTTDLWPNINAAGLVLLAYLVALLAVFYRRKDLTLRRRNVIILLSAVSVIAAVLSWRQMEDQSNWQRNKLGEIGSIIGRGIYNDMVKDSLLVVLEDFYHNNGKKLSLGEVYKKRYPPGNVGDAWSTIEQSGRPNPPDDVFLVEISDSHVVLVARHPWYRGNNAEFLNFNGPKGTLQVRATLTQKGLQYVTEN
ncbi:MAG: hypothetical protein A3H45_06730 [Ignavibacteria bacterium RIFCSPLOWO2_02_FULL_55_14]|nr:MAG: hypothetical protein A2X68_05150 [Ignavibacteria bacterium GWC2_56_12]OGU69962.1 MAG: hypothetical protein A3H45_06730 [Ignavibacteria bacterium RIFCSPLOWO2_02_FULL_55_14]OGU72521.1 MAG: hypothetical protein A3G43_06965 [Ignavibacteria bacterium RIFCSPLOWO2_12_FULL_56_21]